MTDKPTYDQLLAGALLAGECNGYVQEDEEDGLIVVLYFNDTFGYASSFAEVIPWDKTEEYLKAYKKAGYNGVTALHCKEEGFFVIPQILDQVQKAAKKLNIEIPVDTDS